MPPLRRKPIRSSSSSRATAAATTAPATQTVSETTSILPPTATAVRPVPPATLSLADALPEEPTPAMLLEEEALSSETSASSEGSLLSTLEELEEEEPVTPTRPSKPSYTNSSSSKSISQRRNSVVPSEARRWDQTSSHRSSQPGRTPPPSARRRSWRCYRHDILSALEYCAGDGACVRRYLLYHHNINIPSKIIRYYKSSSRSSDLQEGRSSGSSRTSPRQPAES